MIWICKKYDELTVDDLYSILQLRSEIFVVEQNCVFQDMDDKDRLSFHLMAWKNNQLVAYSRLMPPGIAYDELSIGRVVVKNEMRGTGLGNLLMKKSIEAIYELLGKLPIKIGAQLYLKVFYESFEFEQCSDIYDEDGISHIKMIKPNT
jgi:ElaA protein